MRHVSKGALLRFHLMMVAEAQKVGETFRIEPSVRLRSLIELGHTS
jgi:hypothetical protein